MVVALAEAHAQGGKASVPVETLFRAAWPEQSAERNVVDNRVRVAVNTLRNLGLRDVLVTREGGYAFSDEVSIRFVRTMEGDA